jgi:PAS domain S-box-containing protein
MKITDPVKEVRQVVEDEHNLRLLINNMDDPIWLVDTNYIIVDCNVAFRRWVKAFIGLELHKGDHVLFEYQNKLYADKFETCYQLALNGHSFSSVEDFVVNDEVRYCSVSFNPVFNGKREVTAISCFARDITDRRRHLLRIEQQNEALKEIAAIESHKVRGPVATILGLTQLFNFNDYSDPLNQKIVEGIREVTLQLDDVIREVVRRSNELDRLK